MEDPCHWRIGRVIVKPDAQVRRLSDYLTGALEVTGDVTARETVEVEAGGP